MDKLLQSLLYFYSLESLLSRNRFAFSSMFNDKHIVSSLTSDRNGMSVVYNFVSWEGINLLEAGYRPELALISILKMHR